MKILLSFPFFCWQAINFEESVKKSGKKRLIKMWAILVYTLKLQFFLSFSFSFSFPHSLHSLFKKNSPRTFTRTITQLQQTWEHLWQMNSASRQLVSSQKSGNLPQNQVFEFFFEENPSSFPNSCPCKGVREVFLKYLSHPQIAVWKDEIFTPSKQENALWFPPQHIHKV